MLNDGDRVLLPAGTCIVVTNQDGLTTADTLATVIYVDDEAVVMVVDDPSVLPECQRWWNKAEDHVPGHTVVAITDVKEI